MLKEVEFLVYDEAPGVTLGILSIFEVFVILAVAIVYVIHRHTPLVKASDRAELSHSGFSCHTAVFHAFHRQAIRLVLHGPPSHSGPGLFSLSLLRSWKDYFTVFSLQNF